MILLAIVLAHFPHAVESGISIGSALAIVCSWQRNRSILWAILAGMLSWLYVLYFAMPRLPGESR